MTPPAHTCVIGVPVPAAPPKVEARTETAAREPPRFCFVRWLIGRGKSGGAIGELAKAARIDPGFPKSGSADDVRAHFNKAGADGDAFAALDDAELAYDRVAPAADR